MIRINAQASNSREGGNEKPVIPSEVEGPRGRSIGAPRGFLDFAALRSE
jgi:hypothetical protein